jgi:chromosome segregation ATPase
LIKTIHETNHQVVSEFEDRIRQLDSNSKVESTTLLNSVNHEEDLKSKYDSLHQQNLKLKAKLKQMIEQKKAIHPAEDQNLKSTEDLEFLKQTNESQLQTIDSLQHELNNLKELLNQVEADKQTLELKLNSLKETSSLLENSIISKDSEIELLNNDLKHQFNQLNEKSHYLQIQEHLVHDYELRLDQLNKDLNELRHQNKNNFDTDQVNVNYNRIQELEQCVQDSEYKNQQLTNDLNELKRLNECKANEFNDQNLANSQRIQELEELAQGYQLRENQLNSDLNVLKQIMQQNNTESEVVNSLREQVQINLNKIKELELLAEEYKHKNVELNGSLIEMKQQSDYNVKTAEEMQSSLNSKIQVNLERIQELEQSIQESQQRYDQLIVYLNDLRQFSESKTNECNLLNSQLQANLLKIEELEQLAKDYQTRIDQLNGNLIELKQMHENTKIAEGTNKVRVQELEQLVQDYQLKIDQLNSKIEDLGQQKSLASLEIERFKTQIANIQLDSSKIEPTDQLENDYQSKIFELNEQLNELRKLNEDLKTSSQLETKEKDAQINKLNTELTDLKSKIHDELDQSLSNGNSLNHSGNNSINSVTSTRSSSQLENQLKFCHEKCETVVEKLNLLKKQNETLNSKIKSFKAMI